MKLEKELGFKSYNNYDVEEELKEATVEEFQSKLLKKSKLIVPPKKAS